MAVRIWWTKCDYILNLDESLDTFLMVLDIFNDESENLHLEMKTWRNPNDQLQIKFKYKVR